jgi:surfeit locus 1 family protein
VVNAPASSSSPFRGRWLWATLAVALGVLLLVWLGFWQLQRLDQRRAANAFLLERLQEPPLLVDGGTINPDTADLRRAVVRGTYDYTQEIVLRNRTYNELPGVHVLVPLRVNEGDTAVLVDRGWIPYELAVAGQRAAFDGPSEEIELHGIVRRSQAYRGGLSPADPPLGPDRLRLDAWFRVDIPRIQQQIPYRLLPIYLEEEATSTQNAAVGPASPRRFPRPAPDIELSEGPHLVYAIQWFSFAAILLGGYTLLYRRGNSRR